MHDVILTDCGYKMSDKTANAVVQVNVSEAHVSRAGSPVCDQEEVRLLGLEEGVASWPPCMCTQHNMLPHHWPTATRPSDQD